MIFIQVILIVGLLLLLGRLLVNPNSYQVKALTKLSAVLLTFLAVYVVMFPESSNRLAKIMGVTRGADLLLYLLTLAFLFVALSLYIKSKRDQRKIAVLARKIAILEANERYQVGQKT